MSKSLTDADLTALLRELSGFHSYNGPEHALLVRSREAIKFLWLEKDRRHQEIAELHVKYTEQLTAAKRGAAE